MKHYGQVCLLPYQDLTNIGSPICRVFLGQVPFSKGLLCLSLCGLTGRQEVVLLDSEISFNEAIIEEREQGIQEIQHQIGEVNEIFKDLAVLVHEQGTMIGK